MRQLFALLYDILIITSICILLTFPVVIFIYHGQAIPSKNAAYTGYLVCIIFTYFIGLAKLTSQTIGMKAWRLTYEFDNRKHLVLKLFMRYMLFLPMTILYPCQRQHKEQLLKKLCGICVRKQS